MIEHMRRTRRTFLGAVGAGIGAGLAQGTPPWGGRPASAAGTDTATGVPYDASAFQALGRPWRALDTRGALGAHAARLANGDVRVQVAGVAGVPDDAVAIVATITGVARTGPGYVTLWPSGAVRPDVSNLNLEAVGAAVANLATVRLGANGALDLFADRPAELILDIAGWYRRVTGPVGAGRSVLLDTPVRVLDTRSRGVPVAASDSVEVILPRTIPADSTAVLVNLTIVGAAGPGYVSTGPLGDRVAPSTSNLNVNTPGETRAVAATVAVSTLDGRRGFRLWTTTAGHVLVDVMGAVTGPQAAPSTTGLFVPMTPRRLLDTRAAGQAGRTWKSWLVECPVPLLPNAQVGGAVVNVTAVNARGAGYLSVLAARQARRSYESVSHVNVDRRGQTASNHAVSRVARGAGLAVHTSEGSHVLVDLAGVLVGPPVATLTGVVNNPPPPVAKPPWLLEVPALGLRSQVLDGDPDAVTDSGRTWHWTGTGDLGQRAHVVLFAHRTEAGGPLRNVHRLVNGDVIRLHAGDGRVFTYSVAQREITDDQADNILAATRRLEASTVSLVACSRPNGLPTSLSHRLIVTASLVGMTDE